MAAVSEAATSALPPSTASQSTLPTSDSPRADADVTDGSSTTRVSSGRGTGRFPGPHLTNAFSRTLLRRQQSQSGFPPPPTSGPDQSSTHLKAAVPTSLASLAVMQRQDTVDYTSAPHSNSSCGATTVVGTNDSASGPTRKGESPQSPPDPSAADMAKVSAPNGRGGAGAGQFLLTTARHSSLQLRGTAVAGMVKSLTPPPSPRKKVSGAIMAALYRSTARGSNGSESGTSVVSNSAGARNSQSEKKERKEPKKKGSKIWSIRKTAEAPPVPELPHTLNIQLPFETTETGPVTRPVPAVVPTNYAEILAADIEKAHQDENTTANGKDAEYSPAARLQAIHEASLTPTQAIQLIELTSSELKQRGLASMGILRPFRMGSKPEAVDRLAELFLLTIEPEKYSGVLKLNHTTPSEVSTDATFGALATTLFNASSPSRELNRQLAYANINDVAELLKWGLRKVRLTAEVDFSSTQSLDWYRAFVFAEHKAEYPLQAFSRILVPMLPETTVKILTSLLDLFSTIASHFVANAMPASRICKTFGYWLFGRLDNLCTPVEGSWASFVETWTMTSAVLEHLLLAYIRDQSATLPHLPTRLVELIKDYSAASPANNVVCVPGLPPMSRRTVTSQALKVYVDLSAPEQRSRARTPLQKLARALTTSLDDLDSSAAADDWSSLLKLATREVGVHSDSAADLSAGDLYDEPRTPGAVDGPAQGKAQGKGNQARAMVAALLHDESMRILTLCDEQLEARNPELFENDNAEHTTESVTLGSSATRRSGYKMGELSPLVEDSDSSLLRFPVTRKSASENSKPAKAVPFKSIELPLSPPLSAQQESLDWSAFRNSGFASESTADLSLADKGTSARPSMSESTTARKIFSSLSKDDQQHLKKLRRRSSLGTTPYRKKTLSLRSGSQDLLGLSDPAGSTANKGDSIIVAIQGEGVDETLISLWHDAILEGPSSGLSSFVFAQLNAKAAATLMSTAATSAAEQESRGHSIARKDNEAWLVIAEAVRPDPRDANLAKGALTRSRSRLSLASPAWLSRRRSQRLSNRHEVSEGDAGDAANRFPSSFQAPRLGSDLQVRDGAALERSASKYGHGGDHEDDAHSIAGRSLFSVRSFSNRLKKRPSFRGFVKKWNDGDSSDAAFADILKRRSFFGLGSKSAAAAAAASSVDVSSVSQGNAGKPDSKPIEDEEPEIPTRRGPKKSSVAQESSKPDAVHGISQPVLSEDVQPNLAPAGPLDVGEQGRVIQESQASTGPSRLADDPRGSVSVSRPPSRLPGYPDTPTSSHSYSGRRSQGQSAGPCGTDVPLSRATTMSDQHFSDALEAFEGTPAMTSFELPEEGRSRKSGSVRRSIHSRSARRKKNRAHEEEEEGKEEPSRDADVVSV